MEDLNGLELNYQECQTAVDSLIATIDSCDTIIWYNTNTIHDLRTEEELLNIQIAETESVLKSAQMVITQKDKEIQRQKKLKKVIGYIGTIVTLVLLGKIL